FLALSVLMLVAVGLPGQASANHSWGSYHWARTANPFTVPLGNNVSSAWYTQLAGASTDWSQELYGNPVRTAITTGSTTGRKCRAKSGRVEVCNSAYGRNGWLGLASIWISGNHITQGTVKVNDTYFGSGYYNTPIWRAAVLCQEVGHTFGLDHQDESGADFQTCMDYASSPDADNTHPNQHDYEQLASIYSDLDSFTTISAAAPAGSSGRAPQRVDDDLWVEDLGNGRKRYVHVYWANQFAPHYTPPAEG
ncbi:MAG: hypothetical protein LC808_42765, partial [Actinobacteria bacterium]|nr:hypothetical protein [Actinomycetota bacterium]